MNLSARIALSLRKATLHFGPVAVEAPQYGELLSFAKTQGFEGDRTLSLSRQAVGALTALPNAAAIMEQCQAARWHTAWEQVKETPQGQAFLDTILHSEHAPVGGDLSTVPDYTLYHALAVGSYDVGSLNDVLKAARNPNASPKTLKLLLGLANDPVAHRPLLEAIRDHPNADESIKSAVQTKLAPKPTVSPAKMRQEVKRSTDAAWLQEVALEGPTYDGEMAENPHLAPETLELLWTRNSNAGNFRITALIANPNTTTAFLQSKLPGIKDKALRAKVESELSYRAGVEKLAPETRKELTRAMQSPNDTLATRLVKTTSDPQLLNMALRGELKWPEAHIGLANALCPPEALADALTIGPQEKDYNIFDRFVALAENPNVSLEQLLQSLTARKLVLAEHYAKTLFGLFGKKQPTDEQLALMYRVSPSAYLSENLPRPDVVFDAMRKSADDDSRWAVLEDARATPADYTAFMKRGKPAGWSSFEKVKNLLATNQNLPPEFITWLRTAYKDESKFWQIYDLTPHPLSKEEMISRGFRGKDSFSHQALPVDAKVPGYELDAKGTSWVRYIDAADQAEEFPTALFSQFNLHRTPTKNGKPLGWIGGKWDDKTKTLYVTEMQSDLLQRTQELNKPVFEKWRPLRSKLENRFGSWYYTFFNQAVREAQARGATTLAVPTTAAYAKAVPGASGIAPIYEKVVTNYPHETKGKWNIITLTPETRVAMKRNAERNDYTQLEVDTWASHAAIFIKKMVPNEGYVQPSEKEHAFEELKGESRPHLDLTDEAYERFWQAVRTKLISDGLLDGDGDTIDQPDVQPTRDMGTGNREELGLSQQGANRRKNGPDDPNVPPVPGKGKGVTPHDVFNAPDLGDRILDMWEAYKQNSDSELLKVITQWSKHIGCSINQLDRRVARRKEVKAGAIPPIIQRRDDEFRLTNRLPKGP